MKNFNVGPINNKCRHIVKREMFFCKCEFEPFFIIWVLDSEETNFLDVIALAENVIIIGVLDRKETKVFGCKRY